MVALAAALSEPVDVHIVGDGFRLAPILTPLAVIVAAILAAQYARARLHAEIAAADRRQELRLEHDREEAGRRLDRQLKHERSVREREAMRDTVDEVFSAMTKTTDETIELWSANERWQILEQKIDALDPEGPGDSDPSKLAEQLNALSKKKVEALEKAGSSILGMSNSRLRLQLRFPDHHAVLEAFIAWEGDMKKWFDLVSALGQQSTLTEDEEKAIKDAARTNGARIQNFRKAVREWIDEEI